LDRSAAISGNDSTPPVELTQTPIKALDPVDPDRPLNSSCLQLRDPRPVASRADRMARDVQPWSVPGSARVGLRLRTMRPSH
jgi:hypothetical protein